jgi:hypothetical protein
MNPSGTPYNFSVMQRAASYTDTQRLAISSGRKAWTSLYASSATLPYHRTNLTASHDLRSLLRCLVQTAIM